MEEKSRNRSNDEIDLRDLFNSIGNFFSLILRNIVVSIAVVRRATITGIKIFIFSILVLLLLAVLYKSFYPRVYQSNLVIKSPYFTDEFLNSELSGLNEKIRINDYSSLATELEISEETAQQIASFNFTSNIDENELVEVKLIEQQLTKLDVDREVVGGIVAFFDVENRRLFTITVTVKEDIRLDSIEAGLVDYLTNSPYIKQRIDITRTNLLTRRAMLTEEDNELDSLSNAVVKYLRSGRGRSGDASIVTNEAITINPEEISTLKLRINNELLEVERKLFLREDFEIVDGLDNKTKYPNEGWIEVIGWSIIIGIIFSYLIIALRAFNSYLDKVERENAKTA